MSVDISKLESSKKEQLLAILGQEYEDLDVNTLRILAVALMKKCNLLDEKSLSATTEKSYWARLNGKCDHAENVQINKVRNFIYVYNLSDISDILLMDYISRKNMKWKLFTTKDILTFNANLIATGKELFDISEMMLIISNDNIPTDPNEPHYPALTAPVTVPHKHNTDIDSGSSDDPDSERGDGDSSGYRTPDRDDTLICPTPSVWNNSPGPLSPPIVPQWTPWTPQSVFSSQLPPQWPPQWPPYNPFITPSPPIMPGISYPINNVHSYPINNGPPVMTKERQEKFDLEMKIYNDYISSGAARIYSQTITNKAIKLNQNPIKVLEKYCEFITPLLQSQSCLIAAGGAIAKSFIQLDEEELSNYYNLLERSDIDLFFVDCLVEQVEEIILYTWNMISDKRKTDDTFKCCITRNQNTTTIAYKCDQYADEPIETVAGNGVKLQFVHRIYPTKDSVIGGFDIGPGMIFYDGYECYATALGMWSLATRTVLVDTTRRSTSYEFRMAKYNKLGCRIVIPKDSNTYLEANLHKEHENNDGIYNTLYKIFEPVKGLKVRFDDTKGRFIVHYTCATYNKSDYDSDGNVGRLFQTNYIMAYKNRLDVISWRSEDIEDIYHPEIECQKPNWSTTIEKEITVLKREHHHEDVVDQIMKFKVNCNIKIAQEMANRGITIITTDPQRQYKDMSFKSKDKLWTSSINPMVYNVRKYYNNNKTGYLNIGINDDVYVQLRLLLDDVLHIDMFKYLMEWILIAIMCHTENKIINFK